MAEVFGFACLSQCLCCRIVEVRGESPVLDARE